MIKTNLIKAWKALKGNIPYLIIAVILECIFVIALSALQMYYFLPTANAALEAGNIMEQQLADIEQFDAYRLEGMLLENDEFMAAYHIMLTNILLFLAAAFLIFITIRAPLWYLSHKTIHKKIALTTVLWKFPLLSVFWALVMLAILLGYSLLTSSTAGLLPIIGSGTASLISLALVVISVYFAITGFALIPARPTVEKHAKDRRTSFFKHFVLALGDLKQNFINMFTIGWRNAKRIIPAYVVNAIFLALAVILPLTFIKEYTLPALAFLVFITAPTAAYTRLHAIIAVSDKGKP